MLCIKLSSHLSQQYSQPEYVAPLVAAITHPDGPDASGKVFVLGAGYISEIRWERSRGVVFKTDDSFTPSAVSVPLLFFSCQCLDACLHVRLNNDGKRSPISQIRDSEC